MKIAMLCTGKSVLETWPLAKQSQYNIIIALNSVIQETSVVPHVHAFYDHKWSVHNALWHEWNRRFLMYSNAHFNLNCPYTFPCALEMATKYYGRPEFIDIFGWDMSEEGIDPDSNCGTIEPVSGKGTVNRWEHEGGWLFGTRKRGTAIYDPVVHRRVQKDAAGLVFKDPSPGPHPLSGKASGCNADTGL